MPDSVVGDAARERLLFPRSPNAPKQRHLVRVLAANFIAHLLPSPAGAPTSKAPQSLSQYDARVHGLPLVDRMSLYVAARTARPWLALVAVPLAITASMDAMAGLAGSGLLWLTWLPLAFAAWWWAPWRGGEFRWAFLLALEAGVIGIQWSLIGAFALGGWPDSRLLVGSTWIAAALAIAAAAGLNRLRHRSPGL